MSDSGDLLYHVVRFAFAGCLLLFLFLLLRATKKDIDLGTRDAVAPASLAANTAWLHVIDGGGSQLDVGDSMAISKRVVIGRSSDCDVIADDPSVSTVHAALFAEENGWFVEDFGSTNGTYVSGRPVFDVTPVENGEMIQFGRVRVRLMC